MGDMTDAGGTQQVVDIAEARADARPAKFIWEEAFGRSPDLGATTKAVLRAIAGFMDPDGGNAYPSVSTLAERTSYGRNTVRKHIRMARDAGWLVVRERNDAMGDRLSNLYRLRYPPHTKVGGGSPPDPGGSPGDRGVGHEVTPINQGNNQKQQQGAREEGEFGCDVQGPRDGRVGAEGIRRLQERFGLAGLWSTQADQLLALLRDGLDLERDVIPAIARVMERQGGPKDALRYYRGAAFEERDKRLAEERRRNTPPDWERHVSFAARYRNKRPHRRFTDYPDFVWAKSLGPPPWEPGCRAPAELIAKYGFASCG